jgi:hypothetical protein
MNLKEVSFPVFQLRKSDPPIHDNGVLFYEDHLFHEGIEYHEYQVIDDKNLSGATFSARRIQMLARGDKMFKIKQAIYFLGDLIKLASKDSWFIDNQGKLFQYTKEKYGKLIFRNITKIIPIATGGSLIEVEGISTRFKTLFAPSRDKHVAGLLRMGQGYILYGLYDTMYDDTIRKL